MILKAKERGNAPQLAQYLLSMRDNDHVELHAVRGFASDELLGAFHEADAIARGTRCQNYLFSLSLNPPENAHVSTEAFEQAIQKVEARLGLDNQPCAIVFHEKDGRRHAHAVWSRIQSAEMRAINLPHYKAKLKDVSRELFLEHGWDMPRGMQDRSFRDPLSFTRAEWQQSKRAGLDPRELKTVLHQCWEKSDNTASFDLALRERGFWLAKGDRRGFVAVDYRGEVYSLSRFCGVKAKDMKARLGEPDPLRSVSDAKIEIAATMNQKLESFIRDAERQAKHRLALLAFRKAELNDQQRKARQELRAAHAKRWQKESELRASRLPKGFSGIWHRITGQYGKIRAQNEQETLQAYQRDRDEKDALIFEQLVKRQALAQDIRAQRSLASSELLRLREDAANYDRLRQSKPAQERKRESHQASRKTRKGRLRTGYSVLNR